MHAHPYHAILLKSTVFVILSAGTLVAQSGLTPHQVNQLFPEISLDSCLSIIDDELQTGNFDEHAAWISLKGRAYLYHSQHELARINLEQWLEILQQNESGDSILAEAYNYLGVCYDELHLNSSSEEALLSALDHAQQIPDSTELISRIYTNLIYLYSYSHQFKQALAYSHKVLKCDIEAFDEYDSYVHADYVNLARIYHHLNDFPAENRALLQAMRIQKSGKSNLQNRDKSALFKGLTRNYLALENFDSALYFIEENAQLEKLTTNNPHDHIKTQLSIAEIDLKSDKKSAALLALDSAKYLARVRTPESDPIWAEIYFLSGQVAERYFSDNLAIEEFRRVLTFPYTPVQDKSLDHLDLRLKAATKISALLFEKDGTQTIEILTEIVGELISNLWDPARLSATVFLSIKHRSVFTTLCRALERRFTSQGSEHDLELLHQTLAHWKLLTGLEDILQRTLIDGQGPAGKEMRELIQRAADTESRLQLMRASYSPQSNDSIQSLISTRDDLQILIREQLVQFDGGLQNLLQEWTEIPSLKEISEWSSNNGWSLINYLIEGKNIIALIISPSGISTRSWSIPENAQEMINKILKSISNYPNLQFTDENVLQKDLQAYKETAYQLFCAYWRPLEDIVGDKVMLIGVPEMDGLPLGALIVEPDYDMHHWVKSEFLVDRATLSTQGWLQKSTFGQTLLNIRETTIVAPFANDNQNEWFLPASIVEREIVQDIFPNTQSLQGFSVTSSPGQNDLIHFATHAIFDKVHGALYLLIDTMTSRFESRLYLDKIYTQVQSADVVVLNACTTGSTKAIGGSVRSDLGRAFITAGAKHVISTKWDINDRSTTEVMAAFYNNILEECSIPEALNEAVLNYLATHSNYQLHPYHWGSWTTWSAGTRVKANPSKDHFLETGVGILLMLILVHLIKKRVV